MQIRCWIEGRGQWVGPFDDWAAANRHQFDDREMGEIILALHEGKRYQTGGHGAPDSWIERDRPPVVPRPPVEGR